MKEVVTMPLIVRGDGCCWQFAQFGRCQLDRVSQANKRDFATTTGA